LDRSLSGADLAIRMIADDAEPPPGLAAVRFMDNRIGPVAAPGVEPSTARRLLSRSHPSAIDNWTGLTGHALGEEAAPMVFDHQQTMIEACIAGLGVCVTQQPLVETDLASGRLVAPHGFTTDGAAFAVFHRRDPPVGVRRFVTWLQAQ